MSGSTTHGLLFCQFELEQLKSLVAGLKISYYYVLQSFFSCLLIDFILKRKKALELQMLYP